MAQNWPPIFFDKNTPV